MHYFQLDSAFESRESNYLLLYVILTLNNMLPSIHSPACSQGRGWKGISDLMCFAKELNNHIQLAVIQIAGK